MANDVTARRYAIFLRGVNVGGITVRMADLRAELATLPVDDVATVLASGNVTCTSRLAPAELKALMEQALRRRFGYVAWVIVVGHDALRAMFASLTEPAGSSPEEHTYVTFFAGAEELEAFLREARAVPDQPAILAGGTAICWRSPKGRSTDVPLAKLLARARYVSTSTTRNTTTIARVLRLLA